MKKDAKTMKEVAERCMKYSPNEKKCCSNSTQENISCSNCNHYTPEKVCDINLYQEIISNHNL